MGLLSLSSADHSEIGDMCSGLAEQYEGTNVSLSLPSTRVDAFNITLAQELSRNGRRTGLTFAPEGGSERIRRVINKMVSEEDLIRTVVTAYTNGWRQVKLYFMCGLPTETDEDVLQIARLAHEVIKAGRAATGSRDIRCTVSIGGFVPKPHTPFQWAAMAAPEVIDDRLRLLKQAINADRSLGRAIGYRYHDGEPSLIEGLLARGDRRVGAVIRRVWEKGQRFDGWSEHFSYQRWVDAAADGAAALRRGPRLVHHPRAGGARGAALGPPRLRPGQGVALAGLAGLAAASTSRTTAAGRRASTAACARPWTPRSRSARPAGSCCRSPRSGVPGATFAGRRRPDLTQELTISTQATAERNQAPVVQRIRIRYAKRGPLRFTSHRDFARAFERAIRRAGVPIAYSQGFTPHPKISYASAAPTGVASEAEYLEIGLAGRGRPGRRCGRRWTPRSRPAWTCSTWSGAAGGSSLADRIDASRWRIELPGVTPARLAERRGGVPGRGRGAGRAA